MNSRHWITSSHFLRNLQAVEHWRHPQNNAEGKAGPNPKFPQIDQKTHNFHWYILNSCSCNSIFLQTYHQNWQFLNFCNVNLGPVESLASWQCDVHSSTEASLVNRANIVIHTDQSHIRQVTQEHFEFFLNDPNFWGTHFFSTPDNYIGPAKGQTSGWERVKMSHHFDNVRLKYYKEIMWMALVFVKSNCHKWPGLRFINWTKELKSTCYLTIRQYQHI